MHTVLYTESERGEGEMVVNQMFPIGGLICGKVMLQDNQPRYSIVSFVLISVLGGCVQCPYVFLEGSA